MSALFERPIRSTSTAAALCIAAAMAGLGAAPGALAAGAIRAAYVETVIPAKSFTRYLALSNGLPTVTGISSGALGISSITITNFFTLPVVVLAYTRVAVNGSECSGSELLSKDNLLTVIVPAGSTLHLPFPAPIFIEPSNGLSCIAFTDSAGAGTKTYITVNGFIN